MVFKKISLLLLVLGVGIFLPPAAEAQFSPAKMKAGVADANTANLSGESKNLLDRADRLLSGEEAGNRRNDVTPEWRLGYCFQSWFIMMVQYRSLKQNLSPDEAEACTNCVTTYGQKFRKLQKDLGLTDEQMFEALGKSPSIPETYEGFWPPPLP